MKGRPIDKYTENPYIDVVLKTVIEPAAFLNDIRGSGMSGDEHSAIIGSIAQNPEQGAVMAETGGARKVRFAGRGKGKFGGYRIVFYPGLLTSLS